MQFVREVIAFLGGQNDVMLLHLHNELEASAESLDFERARKLRNSINLLQSIVDANVRLARADRPDALVVVQPGAGPGTRNVMLVVRGRIWSATIIETQTSREELASRLASSWKRYIVTGLSAIDHQTLDDTVILMRWLERTGDSACVIRLSVDAEICWEEIAITVLALTDNMLDPAGSDSLLDDHVMEQSDPIDIPQTFVPLIPVPHDYGDHSELSS
jgi:hypothetical protein